MKKDTLKIMRWPVLAAAAERYGSIPQRRRGEAGRVGLSCALSLGVGREGGGGGRGDGGRDGWSDGSGGRTGGCVGAGGVGGDEGGDVSTELPPPCSVPPPPRWSHEGTRTSSCSATARCAEAVAGHRTGPRGRAIGSAVECECECGTLTLKVWGGRSMLQYECGRTQCTESIK